ncbi:eppin [Heterocephalus glaber]|uniref:Eppin n=1 Tax=Heterocephalus glaber TaxID=10181 RepID=A0A0P6JTC6_HETGA|nr:eppin [Heterocephalus glaber]
MFWNHQTGQPFFRMESSGLLSILVVFMLFANVQETAPWHSFRKHCISTLALERAGCQEERNREQFLRWKCPRIRENYEFTERDICKKDSRCEGNKKCCVFSGGRKCSGLKQDVCSLPKEKGLCMAYFRRWWYNKENNTCDLFIYGGCRGNSNNFQTKGICQNFCGRKSLFTQG